VKIAADPELGELVFAGSEDLARSTDGMVARVVEVVDVVGVYPQLTREDFGVERRFGGPRIPG
jgi:hypothetical protein